MATKTALITGVTGQDGRLLSKLLRGKGYTVYGLMRKVVGRSVDQLLDYVHYETGDVRDRSTVNEIIHRELFDEVYHLAAQSDVAYSYVHPDETYDINIGGTLNIINAIHRFSPRTKLYFAGTSELFGKPDRAPQNEGTPMRPRSPYAVSKLSGYWTSKVYREAYGMFIACGILYNHESEIRGPNFVTRKIVQGIKHYLDTGQPFSLGNIYAVKDWGYAPEYVDGMWRMLQVDKPDDFILATNEQHTVMDFLREAFRVANIEARLIHPTGGVDIFIDDDNRGRPIVTVSSSLFRPLESDNYRGDYTKAKQILGWEPHVKFKELVKIMMTAEMNS